MAKEDYAKHSNILCGFRDSDQEQIIPDAEQGGVEGL